METMGVAMLSLSVSRVVGVETPKGKILRNIKHREATGKDFKRQQNLKGAYSNLSQITMKFLPNKRERFESRHSI